MKRAINFAALAFLVACATTQTVPANKYGLHVVPDYATYVRMAEADPDKRLVDISRIPGLRVDVRYATINNFMHQQLYPISRVFLRAPAARALENVERELEAKGLGLKVFDGYRPYAVTERMWEPIKNPDFVADPSKGSRHNRGAAVDLTIVGLASGVEVEMPTPYDDFTERARADYPNRPPAALTNRQTLRDVMTRNGFQPLPSEWWHFDFVGWERFELMNVPLDDLEAHHG